ncbi:MAG: hypothetical protein U0797_13260 [Gemmataceae bacterium]
MKNIIAITLAAGVTLGAAGLAVLASPPPATGRVLVLDNERTLTGDIEQVGDQYRIKRLIGETLIPASKALKLCASLDEAYQFLKGRANLNDADERLRLADWCRQHELREQASEEADAALQLRPRDERVKRLATHLREAKARAQTPQPAPPREPESPRVEVTSESLGLFASKVTPILMNACASCHTGGRGGAFQLTRVSGPGLASRKSLEKNLSSALTQINPKDPAASKLLSKAISIHGPGMTQAPLKGREVTAFRLLEYWVARTAETNPHLREEAHASAAVPPLPSPPPQPKSTDGFGQDRDPKPALAAPMPPKPEAKAAEKPAIADPVDPEGFNREFHPKPGGSR